MGGSLLLAQQAAVAIQSAKGLTCWWSLLNACKLKLGQEQLTDQAPRW